MGTELARDWHDGAVYPRRRLLGFETALVGFAAAFLGRQDCVWIDQAGLTATCVDRDPVRIIEMSEHYPGSWRFACADIYEFGDARRWEGVTYDVVSLDPYTNEAQNCADHIELWCALANRLVVIGTTTGTMLCVPDGWQLVEETRRSVYEGGTYWTTLERIA